MPVKRLLVIALFFVALGVVSAQAPPIEWQNTIGGSGNDQLYSVDQTTDGGYILGGNSASDISGDKTENSQGNFDYWVVKLDTAGAIQWQNTIGGSSFEILRSIQQTGDGGYILGGFSLSSISGDKTENSQGNYDYWVVKLDASGSIQWQNTIGGSSTDELNSIQQTADGGYILGGHSSSNISGDKTENSQGSFDYWVVKLDAVGAIQWQNTIGGWEFDYLYSIQQTSDGGYVLGGRSWSGISGDKTDTSRGGNDYWVVKLDSTGLIQWQNTIGGSINDFLISIEQTADGGYILGGWSSSDSTGDKTEDSQGGRDYWVVKLDIAGSIQWQNTIGGSGTDRLESIQQTSDGGYVMGGVSDSPISGDKTEDSLGGDDYWVVKLDTAGAIQWQNTIGGSGNDQLYSIQQTTDGGYVMGGYSLSNISGDKTENSQGNWDYWVVKLGPDSTTVIVQQLPVNNHQLQVYPNPFSSSTVITLKSPFEKGDLGGWRITLYDILGKRQDASTSLSVTKEGAVVELQRGNLPEGLYFFRITTEEGVLGNGKLVIQD